MTGDGEADGPLVRAMRELVADWGTWLPPDAFDVWSAQDPASRGPFGAFYARFRGREPAPTVAFGATEAASRAPGCIEADLAALFPGDAIESWRASVPEPLRRYLDPEEVIAAGSDAIAAEACVATGAIRADFRLFDHASNAAWFFAASLRLHAAAVAPASVPAGRLGWSRTEALVALGALIERWRWRESALERHAAIRRDQCRTIGNENEGRAEHNRKRRTAGAAWRDRALAIARDLWAERPEPTATAMARHVRRELDREGAASAEGGLPSIRTIRRAIEPERPRRA